MFPDVSSQDQGASVGIIFSRQVNRSDQAKFESLIRQLTALQQAPAAQLQAESRDPAPEYGADERSLTALPAAQIPPEAGADERGSQEGLDLETYQEAQKGKDVGQKIAKGIEIGAEWISWGVVKGAELGSKLVGSGAKRLKQHIQPDEQPTEIDEKYQTGAVYAKKASDVAVKVSVVVLDSVYFLTQRIAEQVGPVISQKADQMLTSGDDETDGKRREVIDGLVQVTASGIKGFGQVYRSLESGAIQLAKSLSEATVETVTHKYGDDAGQLTNNSLSAVGNIGVSAHNFNHLGVKALAKRTAKDTSKVVIKDLENTATKEEKPGQT